MLTDPLVIGVVTDGSDGLNIFAGASVTSLELQDLSETGSVRIGPIPLQGGGGNKGSLTISRSQSNENKPIVTDRTLIRLDVTKVHSVTGKKVTMTAYCVTGLPQGDNPFTLDDQVCLVRHLALFLLIGETTGTAMTAISASDPLLDDTENTLHRILGGVA